MSRELSKFEYGEWHDYGVIGCPGPVSITSGWSEVAWISPVKTENYSYIATLPKHPDGAQIEARIVRKRRQPVPMWGPEEMIGDRWYALRGYRLQEGERVGLEARCDVPVQGEASLQLEIRYGYDGG